MIKKATVLNYDFTMELNNDSILIRGLDGKFNIICAQIMSRKMRIGHSDNKNRIIVNNDNTVSIVLSKHNYKKIKLQYFLDFNHYYKE